MTAAGPTFLHRVLLAVALGGWLAGTPAADHDCGDAADTGPPAVQAGHAGHGMSPGAGVQDHDCEGCGDCAVACAAPAGTASVAPALPPVFDGNATSAGRVAADTPPPGPPLTALYRPPIALRPAAS